MPARSPPGEGQEENREQKQPERDERQDDHQQEPAEGVKQGHPEKVGRPPSGASRVLSGLTPPRP